VFLTPTSQNPYDPYELNCLFNMGKYNHKKLNNIIKKLKVKGRYNWKTRFGASCQWRDGSRDSEGYFMMGSNFNILKK
jgi:hypothetical protein